MGDRANVQFHLNNSPSGTVNLYTHWHGTELPGYVREALDTKAARARWTDESYATRIIVQHILDAHTSAGQETGWGLGTTPDDGEDRIVHLDFFTQRVRIVGWDNDRDITFDEFCAEVAR